MKEIVLDTETTGISVKEGHRIVEIGCVELDNLIPTKNKFHCYLNPERKVSQKAFEVHGYSDDFLSQQKKFSEIVEEFLDFIKDKRLIIHNSEFDIAHLNNELSLNGNKKIENVWEDKKIDLRVDDSEDPVKEIKRLLKVHRAYEHMNQGDVAIEENDTKKALEEYSKAQSLFPNNHEMSFWKGIALLNIGEKKQAKEIFKIVFQKNINWKKLIYRLPKSGIISMSEEELDTYFSDL